MLSRYGENMELRHLRYFVVVAEEQNITRAAGRLRVAQPALSRQLSDLEAEVGVKLLERGRQGARPTAAGREFLRRARAVLADANQAMDAARVAGGAMAGRLTLGFSSALHLDHLSPVIDEFRQAHPKVEFAYVYGVHEAQMKALRGRAIDVAFVDYPVRADNVEHAIVWRVPFEVVLPARHRLAGKKSFELRDLTGEDFVFCTREARPEFYDEFFRHCGNAGFHPNVVQEVGGYPSTMLGLIARGVGLSVLPHFERMEGIRGLVWRPLTRPQLWTDFALVWPQKSDSPLVREFTALARRSLEVALTPS